MSHVATNWAFQQRGLKPATWRVLMCLADRHNPDHGCFPMQKTLAADCEMSRSSLNTHLDILESRGLIRRETSIDEATKQQRPTRYFLAFEGAEAVSNSKTRGAEAVSRKSQKPCPDSGDFRVQNLDTNPVRGTSKRTSKCAREAFDRFWEAYPRKVEKLGARRKFDSAVKSGVDPDRIVAGAEAYARSDAVRRGFVKHPTTWLNAGCWDDDQAPARQPDLPPASQETDQRRAFLRRVAGGSA